MESNDTSINVLVAGKTKMSNRTMLEINHDATPHGDDEILKWGKAMVDYLSSGSPTALPNGVTWFGMRHHTDDCPLKPPRGWFNSGK